MRRSYSHSLQECPYQRDQARIDEAMREFHASKAARTPNRSRRYSTGGAVAERYFQAPELAPPSPMDKLVQEQTERLKKRPRASLDGPLRVGTPPPPPMPAGPPMPHYYYAAPPNPYHHARPAVPYTGVQLWAEPPAVQDPYHPGAHPGGAYQTSDPTSPFWDGAGGGGGGAYQTSDPTSPLWNGAAAGTQPYNTYATYAPPQPAQYGGYGGFPAASPPPPPRPAGT